MIDEGKVPTLKEFRELRGMSLAELADRSGIPQQLLERWEEVGIDAAPATRKADFFSDVCLAGAAAQEVLAGDGEPVELAGNDLSGATLLLGSLGGSSDQMRAAADDAEERAEGILRREWAAVEAVAARLVERDGLDGDEVARIIERGERV